MRASRKKPQNIVAPSRRQGRYVWLGLASLAVVFAIAPIIVLLLMWRTGMTTATTQTASVQTASMVPGVVSPECPGEPQTIELTNAWNVLNPGRKCRIIHNFPTGEVEFRDRGSTFLAGSWQAGRPDRARSVAGTLEVTYSLCPPRTGNRPVNWDCSYM